MNKISRKNLPMEEIKSDWSYDSCTFDSIKQETIDLGGKKNISFYNCRFNKSELTMGLCSNIIFKNCSFTHLWVVVCEEILFKNCYFVYIATKKGMNTKNRKIKFEKCKTKYLDLSKDGLNLNMRTIHKKIMCEILFKGNKCYEYVGDKCI